MRPVAIGPVLSHNDNIWKIAANIPQAAVPCANDDIYFGGKFPATLTIVPVNIASIPFDPAVVINVIIKNSFCHLSVSIFTNTVVIINTIKINDSDVIILIRIEILRKKINFYTKIKQ